MIPSNILVASFIVVAFAPSCQRRESTREDAIEALREMSIKEPGMAFQPELDLIENDPRILAGERFRPSCLIFFSMLDSDIAELRYSIFWIGGDPPPANAWTLTFGRQKIRAKSMDDPGFGADDDKVIDGRFSWFEIYFYVPRNDFIDALQNDPSITLSCIRYPSNSWTFASEWFAKNLAEMRTYCIEKREPAMELQVKSMQMNFYGRGEGIGAPKTGTGHPATAPE